MAPQENQKAPPAKVTSTGSGNLAKAEDTTSKAASKAGQPKAKAPRLSEERKAAKRPPTSEAAEKLTPKQESSSEGALELLHQTFALQVSRRRHFDVQFGAPLETKKQLFTNAATDVMLPPTLEAQWSSSSTSKSVGEGDPKVLNQPPEWPDYTPQVDEEAVKLMNDTVAMQLGKRPPRKFSSAAQVEAPKRTKKQAIRERKLAAKRKWARADLIPADHPSVLRAHEVDFVEENHGTRRHPAMVRRFIKTRTEARYYDFGLRPVLGVRGGVAGFGWATPRSRACVRKRLAYKMVELGKLGGFSTENPYFVKLGQMEKENLLASYPLLEQTRAKLRSDNVTLKEFKVLFSQMEFVYDSWLSAVRRGKALSDPGFTVKKPPGWSW